MAAGRASPLDAIADELALDGWRRRAVALDARARAAIACPALFSLAELLVLGGGASRRDLDAWGMSALDASGCVCTRLPPPGRWRIADGPARSWR